MRANGWVYETFGISKRFPIKPLQSLLNVPLLKLALSAKCFIYRVCAQHEHVPTYFKALNKFVKYKFLMGIKHKCA